MYGVLGLDSIEDEQYRKFLLMYKQSDDSTAETKKFSLYPFGMSEKLFLPKTQHEKIANVFMRFQKALDQDFKQKEKSYSQCMDKVNSSQQYSM